MTKNAQQITCALSNKSILFFISVIIIAKEESWGQVLISDKINMLSLANRWSQRIRERYPKASALYGKLRLLWALCQQKKKKRNSCHSSQCTFEGEFWIFESQRRMVRPMWAEKLQIWLVLSAFQRMRQQDKCSA